MQNINPLSGIIKSILGPESALDSAAIPPVFAAVVKDVNPGRVLLLWQNKEIEAVLETTVKKNERLLLQRYEENNGKLLYKILARTDGEQINRDTYLHTVMLQKNEATPYYCLIKEYRHNTNTPDTPYLDVVFPTLNLGLVGIRIMSCHEPYACSFLTEETAVGIMLTSTITRWVEENKALPVKLLPPAVINRQDYLTGNTVINRKV